jgi:flagellar hook-associated protein 3 FlgL
MIMRISTSMIYDRGVGGMQQQWSSLMQTQQQLSSGRRVLTPADDPVASARAVEIGQSRAVNERFLVNIGAADDAMGLMEGHLQGAGEILHYVRERAVQAGNAALSPVDLKNMAVDVNAQFEAMMAIGNAKDGVGDFLFSGYKADTQPFGGTVDAVVYDGDQGERSMQVSASRVMSVSLPGNQVFANALEALGELARGLEDPTAVPGGIAAVVSTALDKLDVGQEDLLRARAQIGSQMTETATLRNIGSDRDIQYASTLSDLQDLDYAEAISRLTRQQTSLEAAQQSFMRLSGLSLFNYLR